MLSLPRIRKKVLIPLLSTLVLLFSIAAGVVLVQQQQELRSKAAGNTYYVATNGSDESPGTESRPFKTVQRAINAADSGDLVFIRNGTYNLSGFSKTINYPLTLVGEDKNSTVLRNGGTLTFTDTFTIRNLKFADSTNQLFILNVGSGKTVSGVTIDNSIFERVVKVIRGYSSGTIKDLSISNSQFLDLISASDKIMAIRFSEGIITNMRITDNTFRNLIANANDQSSNAILIGRSGSRDKVHDLFITGNVMENIQGGTELKSGNQHPEVHGIHAFGNNINILNNVVRNLNQGKDHEAIYIKADHSTIANNVVHNGGSDGFGDGDITLKGGANIDNVVSGNRVTADQTGNAITTWGEIILTNNCINKKGRDGRVGLNVIAEGKSVVVRNNHVETDQAQESLRVDNANGVEISGNVVISHNPAKETIKVKNSSNVQMSNNRECKGSCASLSDNCSSTPIPALSPTPTPKPIYTTTPTPTPPPTGELTITPMPPGLNIIRNPGFEVVDSTGKPLEWKSYSDGSASFSSSGPGTEGTRAAKFSITTQGGNVQVYQFNLELEANSDYVLAFDAYSNTGHDMRVLVHKHGSPYTNYGLASDTIDLGTSWKSFSIPFTTNDLGGTSVADARLRFWMAPYDEAGDEYLIDAVLLTKTSTTCNLIGDINCDGVVNILDFQILSNKFGTNDSASDLNSDGIVNILDFQILNNNFGKGGG